MTDDGQDKKPEGIGFHMVALVAGLLMMIAGVGLSVTMVLLPVGIPLGLVGLLVFVWALSPGQGK